VVLPDGAKNSSTPQIVVSLHFAHYIIASISRSGSRQVKSRADDSHSSGSVLTVRVMVLADVRLYREGLARLLAGHPNLTVVPAGPVNEDFLLRVRAEHVDVILLEAATACETRVVQDLAHLAPETKIVAYGVLDEERQVLRCAEAGAAAFMTADATAEQLVSAILGVGRGEINCSARVTALLVNRLQTLSQGLASGGNTPGSHRGSATLSV
jgi:DNA-binding NarL/FixJ family response regulator